MQPQNISERAALRRGSVTGRRWLSLLLTLWALSFGAAGSVQAQKLPPVNITGDPVAPNPRDSKNNIAPGTGLCGGFRLIGSGATAATVFKPRPAGFPNVGATDFPDSVNAFMDGMTGGPMSGMRVDVTMQNPFDLTNQAVAASTTGRGDFAGTRGCPLYMGQDYGCWFPGAPQDPVVLSTGFGSRFRGFVNILPEWVNQSMHFGFFTNDAVAMYIYTKAKPPNGPEQKLVISRGVEFGSEQYRVTNTVRFSKAGLFPIEVTFANYLGPAALEMVVLFDSSYVDVDTPAVPGPSPLNAFSLDYTQPTQFFQTASGVLPYDGEPTRCKQCPRSLANVPNQPSGTCDAGMFCNEAAVCAPCIGDQFCGKSCKECLAPEPFCIRDPRDPSGDYQCAECRDDMDCSAGRKCVQGKCVNPCNCCRTVLCADRSEKARCAQLFAVPHRFGLWRWQV